MLKIIQKSLISLYGKRFFSKQFGSRDGFKVSVVGAASEVGQSLSLILRNNNLISNLALFDDVPLIRSLAVDLSQISSKSKVTGHNGRECLHQFSKDSKVIVITNGFSKKLILSRNDIVNNNAKLLKEVLPTMAEASPNALIAIALYPINVMVPIAGLVLQNCGFYDPKKLFGVTNLKELRAKLFLADELKTDPKIVKINVIGGNSGCSSVPVISGAAPKFHKSERVIEALSKKIQSIGEPLYCSNASQQLTPVAMASAIANFVDSLLRALNSEPNIYECSFVESNISNCNFFATQVELTTDGIHRIVGLPKLTTYEGKLLQQAIPLIQEDFELGMKIGMEK